MGMPPVGEMDFDGLILDADFIGCKTIRGERCNCFQPSFDDCTLVRCEPLNDSKAFFINAEDF